jgi:hypothetical protein
MKWDSLWKWEAGQGEELYEHVFSWKIFLQYLYQKILEYDLVIQQQNIRDTSYAGTARHSGDYLTVQVYGVPFEQTLQCEMDFVTTDLCSLNGETIEIEKVVNFIWI